MKTLIAISAVAWAAGLAGCAVGPDYQRAGALPHQPLPEKFSDNNPTNVVYWKIAEPAANVPRGEWWQMFDDAELNRLETLSLTNNQDLAAAAARFEQARDLVAAARSEFYPQLSAGGTPNGDITRQRTSVNQPQLGQPAGAARTYDTFTAPVYLGWELDLWGRVRKLSQAAHARYTASLDDFESAKLAVAAEVATDYFSLRTLDDEYTLIANTIEAYRYSLTLTQNRRRGGIVSDLDVAQAATLLHTAEVQLPAVDLRRTQTRHALAVLCGDSPETFLVGKAATPTTVPNVPPSVPSGLLEHRPDIAANERRMAAANADIGVAQAAFFPTFKIDGLAGFQSIGFSSWFNWPSRFWAVGPSLELPLFTGGLNRANLAATHAAYDETVATYRQTVLTALGEVEDDLAAQRLLADESHAENEAVAAAQHALEIANNRYQAGLVTYLDVATAQTQALNEERNAVQLQSDRLTAVINLMKALGGNWR
jgi:multidrug efflux system outer membrane protein